MRVKDDVFVGALKRALEFVEKGHGDSESNYVRILPDMIQVYVNTHLYRHNLAGAIESDAVFDIALHYQAVKELIRQLGKCYGHCLEIEIAEGAILVNAINGDRYRYPARFDWHDYDLSVVSKMTDVPADSSLALPISMVSDFWRLVSALVPKNGENVISLSRVWLRGPGNGILAEFKSDDATLLVVFNRG